MSNVIAIVKNLVGQAATADGVQRQPAEGDHIYRARRLPGRPTRRLALTAEGQALVASTLGSDQMLAGKATAAGLPSSSARLPGQSGSELHTPTQTVAADEQPKTPATTSRRSAHDGNTHVILGSPDNDGLHPSGRPVSA